MRRALNFFEEKIKFTYEPIPDVFKEIASKMQPNIGKIFKRWGDKMEENSTSAGEAWEEALKNENTAFLQKKIMKY